jgi:thiamine transport system substrate-binding protein
MLSNQFQEDIPLQMFVYPVNPDATLPEAFTQYAQRPEQPATLAPDVIAAKRDAWIKAWTDVVLK